MKKLTQIRQILTNSMEIKQKAHEDDELLEMLESLIEQCILTLKSNGKIIMFGNGGSFADAQHIVAEFVSRFRFDRAPLAALALGTNSSIMTAAGNDYGYNEVFRRELIAVAGKNDTVIALSTSGKSQNVLNALDAAHQRNIPSYLLTGAERSVANCYHICVPSTDTARIQETHITFGHIICELIESHIFTEAKYD